MPDCRDPDTDPDVGGRDLEALGRARSVWAGRLVALAVGLHVLSAAAVAVAVLRGVRPESALLTAVLIGATVVPVLVMAWVEWRNPSRTRPVQWPLRSVAVGLPQAAAAAVVAGSAAGPALAAAAGVVVLLVPLGTAALAGRALRTPLTPDLGTLDVEIIEKIRVLGAGRNRWSASDVASLTSDDLHITLWPDLRTHRRYTISLATVGEVTVRPATARDNPWITLDTGQTYSIPPGTTVLALTHRAGSGILPVYRPQEFAALLDMRRRAAARRRR